MSKIDYYKGFLSYFKVFSIGKHLIFTMRYILFVSYVIIHIKIKNNILYDGFTTLFDDTGAGLSISTS